MDWKFFFVGVLLGAGLAWVRTQQAAPRTSGNYPAPGFGTSGSGFGS